VASRTPKTLHPQDEVSHYRIIGPLGAGGMGEVYLAQDLSLERRVALKILPPDLVRSEDRLRRFVLEAKSASSLSHPNIVTIFEIGSDEVRVPGEPPSGAVHFISMELVTGRTLASLIHEEKADLRTLLGHFAQAAEGLAKAHAAGIVHRDLKPGNIMVSADGYAKVLDFGLAKLTEKGATGPETSSAATMAAEATGEGIVVGTAGYMSPEQVQGKTVDARSDIFSFGCMLYEAATRRHPFRAETTIETLHRILNDTPPPVEEINPKVPADLRRLIRRCLAKNPEQRLQSMKDLALDLREIVDHYDELSASSSSGSGGSSPGSAALRKRGIGSVAWSIVAIVVVAAAAIVWWALNQRNRASSAQPFQNMEITTVTNRGDVLECALSKEGRYLAYLAGPPGQVSLHVRQVATGSDVEVLPATSATIEHLSFSLDGNYLFYLMRKADAQNYRSLYQIPSLGGVPQQRTFDVDTRVTFSPDGKQLAFMRGIPQQHEWQMVAVDLESWKERVITRIAESLFPNGGPAWAPDGKTIAVPLLPGGGTLRSEIGYFDPTHGFRQSLREIPHAEVRSIAWIEDGTGLVAEGWGTVGAVHPQVFMLSYPATTLQRITNDFGEYSGVSVSSGAEAIAAVRQTRLANVWIADVSGANTRPLTNMTNSDNSVFDFCAVDTGTIAFIAPGDQGLQAFSLPVSGGKSDPITSGSGSPVAILGEGERIAFTSLQDAGMHVWSVNKDGTELRQLTTGSGERAVALSPDGQFVVFARPDSIGTIWRIPIGGGVPAIFATRVWGFIGFSPDGRHVLISHPDHGPGGLIGGTILVMPAAGGAATDSLRLTGRAVAIGWSGDSRGILYLDGSDPVHNIYLQRFGAAAPVRLTSYTDGRVLFFSPSPDGRKLAIARQMGPSANAWIADADGSRPVQVSRFTNQRVFLVKWMPDSRRLGIGAGTLSRDAVLVRKFR